MTPASRIGTAPFAALALALTLALTGCSATNPITTRTPYGASDGVRLELGAQVTAINLMVVSADATGPGVLLGALTNRSTVATTVTITNAVDITGYPAPPADGEYTVEVPLAPGETALLGSTAGVPTSVPMANAPLGGLLGLEVSTPESGAETVLVPVLDGALPEYATVAPPAG